MSVWNVVELDCFAERPNPLTICLLPAKESDKEFVRGIHRLSMKESISAAWGWDDAAQKKWFDSHYEPKVLKIVYVAGAAIGSVMFKQREKEWYLDWFFLHPDWHEMGIGSAILEHFLKTVDQTEMPVVLDAVRGSRSRKLYEKFDFQVEETNEQMDVMVRRKNVRDI